MVSKIKTLDLSSVILKINIQSFSNNGNNMTMGQGCILMWCTRQQLVENPIGPTNLFSIMNSPHEKHLLCRDPIKFRFMKNNTSQDFVEQPIFHILDEHSFGFLGLKRSVQISQESPKLIQLKVRRRIT